MSAAAPDQAVEPGRPILVTVVLVAPEKPIDYDQRILLQSDNPRCPNLTLRIKADVGRPLAAEPSPLQLTDSAAGEPLEGAVTIRNRGRDPVRLIYSTAASPGCFARLPREPVPPLGTLTVPVVVSAGTRGPQTVALQIRTDSAGQPSLEVQIRVRPAAAS